MGEVTMSANNQSAQGGDNHINLYEPHVWKHHTKVAGLEWKNPVGTASGTFQYAAVRWFYDVSQLGAVCTKGASPVPWEGNPSPRTAESPAANINAVGLQNPGIDHYLAEDLPKLKAAGAFVISNVAGHCDDDYAAVVEKLADSDADMLEINVSCPNVSAGGMSVGTDPVALANLMDRLRPMTDKPMIVKLTPNVTDITVPARAAVEHGADALSMINTLKGMRINIRTGKPIIANVTGGVSGPAVLPVGLAAVYPASQFPSAVFTVVNKPSFTIKAGSAECLAIGRHTHACAQFNHLRTCLNHLSHKFVAQYNSGYGSRHRPIPDMEITGADRGTHYPDNGILRIPDNRYRPLFQAYIANTVVYCGLHGDRPVIDKFFFHLSPI